MILLHQKTKTKQCNCSVYLLLVSGIFPNCWSSARTKSSTVSAAMVSEATCRDDFTCSKFILIRGSSGYSTTRNTCPINHPKKTQSKIMSESLLLVVCTRTHFLLIYQTPHPLSCSSKYPSSPPCLFPSWKSHQMKAGPLPVWWTCWLIQIRMHSSTELLSKMSSLSLKLRHLLMKGGFQYRTRKFMVACLSLMMRLDCSLVLST